MVAPYVEHQDNGILVTPSSYMSYASWETFTKVKKECAE